MIRSFLVLLLLACGIGSFAQRKPDQVYMDQIRTVKLFQQNDQMSIPLIRLNSGDQLELHFDDLMPYARNFFYTYELCNADWTPALLNPFDYMRGFTQNRLSQYRVASIALTRYVHYQAMLPERNCMPTKSGNYLLKVFLDGDTSKLAFTKRLMVLDERAAIGARVMQPFMAALTRTHQKLQVTVATKDLNVMSPQQQTKLVMLQNNQWDEAVVNDKPTFMRGSTWEYNGEQDALFPAGKEYRWADLRSFRFLTDRMENINMRVQPHQIQMKTDLVRNDARYAFFRDTNGWNEISTNGTVNPWWQGDYAHVEFTLQPPAQKPFAGRNVYLMGELTGNRAGDTSRMVFDETRGVYTKTLFLKQGYYSYRYTTLDNKGTEKISDPSITEGNFWETENDYLILFYFRPLTSRHDELVGMTRVNSRAGNF